MTVSSDGGAFIEPPTYKFHNAYLTIVNEETSKLIHHEKDIGNFEYSLKTKTISIPINNTNNKTNPIINFLFSLPKSSFL